MFWKRKKSKFEIELEEYNENYTEPFGETSNDGDGNMILSQNVFLSLNSRQTRRNNNVFVVGGAGTGKSMHFVRPNILQANANYVVTDPFGDLFESTGPFLKENGYKVQVFDLVEMGKSEKYNPLDLVKTDKDIEDLVKDFMKNSAIAVGKEDDAFFTKIESELLLALIFYLVRHRPAEERNFVNVLKLLEKGDPADADESGLSQLDLIFKDVKANNQNSLAAEHYETFSKSAGKFKKSILLSLSIRLSIFNYQDFKDITSQTTIDINTMKTGKMALFIKTPITDNAYNFIVSMLICQLAKTVADGDNAPTNHIRFMVDEFANIGYIGSITMLMATSRRYNMSFSIITQNLSQLKALYPYEWESIIDNCDSFLFLGGRDYATLEYISKFIGKQEVMINQNDKNKKQNPMYLQNPEVMLNFDMSTCIVFVRGVKPFIDQKFVYENHKNYKFTINE